jgi:hypothetical protein
MEISYFNVAGQGLKKGEIMNFDEAAGAPPDPGSLSLGEGLPRRRIGSIMTGE